MVKKLIFGVDSKAIRQARYAIGIGREYAQLAYWAGGLASWRSGQIDVAGQFFRTLASLAEANPGERSAAAYWAHRVEMRQGRQLESIRYLEVSAAVSSFCFCDISIFKFITHQSQVTGFWGFGVP